MQLIILLLLHTRRIPEKNKSKQKLQLIFNVQIYRKCSSLLFTHECWFSMIDAYFAMSQSLMVPKAEKTDRISSSVRSLWMLARYNLEANALKRSFASFAQLHSPVVFFSLIHDLIDACLRLRHLTGSPHLQGLNSDVNGGSF